MFQGRCLPGWQMRLAALAASSRIPRKRTANKLRAVEFFGLQFGEGVKADGNLGEFSALG